MGVGVSGSNYQLPKMPKFIEIYVIIYISSNIIKYPCGISIEANKASSKVRTNLARDLHIVRFSVMLSKSHGEWPMDKSM